MSYVKIENEMEKYIFVTMIKMTENKKCFELKIFLNNYLDITVAVQVVLRRSFTASVMNHGLIEVTLVIFIFIIKSVDLNQLISFPFL